MLIQITNLSFSYNHHPLLNGISCAIGKGETWAVIGKNGAGKSTLIKCIGRLLKVKAGTIAVAGKDVERYHPRDLATVIAYVPQASGRSLPPYTVYDYVTMGRFPYQGFMAMPGTRDREIVAQALALTDTGDLAERSMATLSGGEIQRVFIAGAVAQQTQILLLDEPVAFLDPLHQELIHHTLEKIHAEYGTTLVTVTHDVNAALNRYSHVLALSDGKAFFAGPVEGFMSGQRERLETIFGIAFEEARTAGGRPVIVPGALP